MARHTATLTILYLSLITTQAVANSLDINLHDNAFRITYSRYIEKNTVTDVGLLSVQEHERRGDDAELIHAGINFESGNLRLGTRAIYTSLNSGDVLAVGFGGQGRVALSKVIGLGGHFYYAPSITSFLDGDGYHEFALRLDAQLSRKAQVYLGYRNIKVRLDNSDNKIELDDDFHIGLKLYF